MITADKLNVGEFLEPLVLKITPEINQQILESVGCNDKRYKELVHPSLLIGFSNLTRSPSYRLEDGVAAVHTNDEVEFLKEVKVGETITIEWVVTDIYYKRNRDWKDMKHQTILINVINNVKELVLRRRMTDVYVRN